MSESCGCLLKRFHFAVVQQERRALLEKIHGDQQSGLSLTPQNESFIAAKCPRANADRFAGLET